MPMKTGEGGIQKMIYISNKFNYDERRLAESEKAIFSNNPLQ